MVNDDLTRQDAEKRLLRYLQAAGGSIQGAAAA